MPDLRKQYIRNVAEVRQTAKFLWKRNRRRDELLIAIPRSLLNKNRRSADTTQPIFEP